jgi:hypothetical protein
VDTGRLIGTYPMAIADGLTIEESEAMRGNRSEQDNE